jgi:hypothetical protein
VPAQVDPRRVDSLKREDVIEREHGSSSSLTSQIITEAASRR